MNRLLRMPWLGRSGCGASEGSGHERLDRDQRPLYSIDMQSKRCRGCDALKALTDFPRGGHAARCRACLSNYCRLKRLANLTSSRCVGRLAWAKYYAANRGKVLAYQKAWRRAHPLERRAQGTLRTALRAGLIVKPTVCDCGRRGRLHAHHADYARPLAVEWLCPPCHKVRHKKER